MNILKPKGFKLAHPDHVTIAVRTRLRNISETVHRFLMNCCHARRIAYNYAVEMTLEHYQECLAKSIRVDTYTFINDIVRPTFNAAKYQQGQVFRNIVGTGHFSWMNDRHIPPSVTQFATNEYIKQAWSGYYDKRTGKPEKHKYRSAKSFTISTNDYHLLSEDPQTIWIRGTGNLRLAELIPYESFGLGNATLSLEGDKWYISFSITIDSSSWFRHTKKDSKDKKVAVDVGVRIAYALSDNSLGEGQCIHSPKRLAKLQNDKNYINRKISKLEHKHILDTVATCEKCCEKVKGTGDSKKLCNVCSESFSALRQSRYLKKLRSRVWAISRNQVHIRNRMIEEVTSFLAENYEYVAIEDLRIKNMTRSAKGTQEKKGKNVRAKSGLNREFLNMSPGRFHVILEQKIHKVGGTLILVDPKDTSRKCSKCHYIDAGNRKRGIFHCLKCDYTEDADINASYNIYERAFKKTENKIALSSAEQLELKAT
ncbi:RNA-guided endonuclease InsQ/TnpB family protein [Vibrio astriarenae]